MYKLLNRLVNLFGNIKYSDFVISFFAILALLVLMSLISNSNEEQIDYNAKQYAIKLAQQDAEQNKQELRAQAAWSGK